MAELQADIEQFEVEITAPEPLGFSADQDDALQLTAEDYKIIGRWGSIGGDIEKQKDLIKRLEAIETETQIEPISSEYIENLN